MSKIRGAIRTTAAHDLSFLTERQDLMTGDQLRQSDRIRKLEDQHRSVHLFHARMTDELRGRLDDIVSLNKQLDDVRSVDAEQDEGAAVLSDRITNLTRAVEGFAMKLEGMSSYTGYSEFSADLEHADNEAERGLDMAANQARERTNTDIRDAQGPASPSLKEIADKVVSDAYLYGQGMLKVEHVPRTDAYTDEEVLAMRRFELHQYGFEDKRVVAGGREYPDGHLVLTWLADLVTEIYPDMACLERRHLHQSSTVLEFLDP